MVYLFREGLPGFVLILSGVYSLEVKSVKKMAFYPTFSLDTIPGVCYI
jgi:hypothetical protein